MKVFLWNRKNLTALLSIALLLSILACVSEPDDDSNNGSQTTVNAGGGGGGGGGGTGDGGASCDDPQVLTRDDLGGGGTIEEGCYSISGTITVGGLLTVKPGVTIKFGPDAGLDIQDNGQLSAIGTDQKRILFTGSQATPGHWRGLQYFGSRSNNNVLEHVTVEYAGSSGWHGHAPTSTGGIFIRGSQVALSIKDSTIRGNRYAGIYIDDNDADFTIASSLFEDNEVPIRTTPNLIRGLAEDNQFKNNEPPYILVHNTAPIITDQTWPAFTIPYRIDKEVRVRADWTLTPGTTLEFNQGAGIFVDSSGTLTADAADADRIQFVPPPGETARGAWKGIGFADTRSSKNTFKNVDILYAGGIPWTGNSNHRGAIYLKDSLISLSDVKIAGSARYGIVTWTDSTAVEPCDDVTFEDNADDDLSGDGLEACL